MWYEERWIKYVSALLTVLVGVVVGRSVCAFSAPNSEHRKWDTYRVFLWMFQGPGRTPQLVEALKGLAINGINVYNHEPTSDFAVSSNLSFYVDNIAGKGDLYLNRNEWQKTWNVYWASRNKSAFVRPRCLNDPAVIDRMRKKVNDAIALHKDKSPVAYALDDEISITSFANPFDFCFSPYCLKKFRTWLSVTYKDISALNAEWETKFKSWDEVLPFTTDEIRQREFAKNLRSYNFSPWADHRTFMDNVLAETVKSLVEYAKRLDPATPTGITGGQAPSAFGGYDWWKLMQAIDFVEPYDLGSSREIVRSFNKRNIPIVATVGKTEAKENENVWRLWYNLAHGDRGTIIWSSGDYFKDKDPAKPSPYALSLTNTFKELTSSNFVKITAEGTFQQDGIAIYYSQPSIQAHWMLDSKGDDKTWPKRLTSHELTNSSIIRDNEAWRKLVEDLGFQYNFVSYEQVKEGELLKGAYKALIMPKTICLSDKEAEEITKFVQQGGLLIADYQTALMDEHGKSRPKGRLDDLFGISRKGFSVAEDYGKLRPIIGQTFRGLTIAEPLISAASTKDFKKVQDVPCLIHNKSGKGRTWYLNLGLMNYPSVSSQSEGATMRTLLRETFKDAALRPKLNVLSNGQEMPDCERIFYSAQSKGYLFILTNKFKGKSNPFNIKLVFSHPVELKNLRTGKSFNKAKEFEDTFSSHEANLYEVVHSQ